MNSPSLDTRTPAMAGQPILPPAIEGMPLVGSLPEFIHDPLGFLERCGREHGDAVRMRFAHVYVYSFYHPDLIEEVLVTQNANFIKPIDLREAKNALGEGLLTSEGEHWRRERRLAQPAFHHERIAAYARLMTEYAEQMAETWRDGEDRDAHQEMMQLTLNIIAKALFDLEIGEAATAMGRALEAVLEQYVARSNTAFLLPASFPTPGNLRARRAIQRLDDLVYGMIAERRAQPRKSNDLLTAFLEARYEDGSAMPEKQIRDELITLLSAGHETTAIALSWTWYLLGQHPEVEAKLIEELQAVLGGKTPALEDAPRLSYTEKVVRESMRLFPPAWSIGREAIRDCKIGRYFVPKGMTIYMSQWAVHRDPRFYEDPLRFHPGRWTEEFQKRLPKFAYFPFGGGPRVCIGAGFAMMEAVLLLATIAQRFHLRLVPEHRVTPWPSITLRPRHGVRVVPTRR